MNNRCNKLLQGVIPLPLLRNTCIGGAHLWRIPEEKKQGRRVTKSARFLSDLKDPASASAAQLAARSARSATSVSGPLCCVADFTIMPVLVATWGNRPTDLKGHPARIHNPFRTAHNKNFAHNMPVLYHNTRVTFAIFLPSRGSRCTWNRCKEHEFVRVQDMISCACIYTL